LIPEAQQEEDTHAATAGGTLGFALTMLLDVALG
jgi:zinc transporter ZupT